MVEGGIELKEWINNICDENANNAQQCEAIEDKHIRASNDLDRMTKV